MTLVHPNLTDDHRADTCCAILLRTKPTLQPALVPNALEPAIPGFTIGNLSERLSPLTASSHLTSGILYIYLRLRYLTQFFTTIPASLSTVTSSSKSNLLDESFFSDKIDFIERAILALLSSEALAESPFAAFLTAFLNAALIFVYEELREVPKWNNVSLCLGQRIRSGLELVELERAMTCCPELLLWVLMLGRSGAYPLELGARGRLWFDREIKMVEDVFGVEVPVNLKAIKGLNYFEIAEGAVANLRSGGKTDEEGDVRDEGG
jgi:hypothetical protein